MENTLFSVNTGDNAWIMVSTGLVFFMVPGLGFFYSGMAHTKNSLSPIILSFLSLAVVSVQWTLFGYSLAFSETSANSFIGDFRYGLHLKVRGMMSIVAPKLPAITFSTFQCMFAGITPALSIGAVSERVRILPTCVFFVLWTTFVYDFVAYWMWNPNGFLFKLGGLDFAGGTVVHINSGVSGFIFAHFIGKKLDYKEAPISPNSVFNIAVGTSLLWFGFIGFNCGGNYSADTVAGYA
ncbi:Ammonium transporter 1, partial [Smittium mucronatum]